MRTKTDYSALEFISSDVDAQATALGPTNIINAAGQVLTVTQQNELDLRAYDKVLMKHVSFFLTLLLPLCALRTWPMPISSIFRLSSSPLHLKI